MAPFYKSTIDLPKGLPGLTEPEDPSGGVSGGNIWGDWGAGFFDKPADNTGNDSSGRDTLRTHHKVINT